MEALQGVTQLKIVGKPSAGGAAWLTIAAPSKVRDGRETEGWATKERHKNWRSLELSLSLQPTIVK